MVSCGLNHSRWFCSRPNGRGEGALPFAEMNIHIYIYIYIYIFFPLLVSEGINHCLESPRPFKNGSMTPLFWVMIPFFKGHGDPRWPHIFSFFQGAKTQIEVPGSLPEASPTSLQGHLRPNLRSPQTPRTETHPNLRRTKHRQGCLKDLQYLLL